MLCIPLAQADAEKGLAIATEQKVRDRGWGDSESELQMVLRPAQGRESVRRMRTLALEVQGDWLWKLESIYRRSGPFDYVAATGGFEYTRVGVFGQSWDLGWIAEYQYDSRGKAATLPGQNDLFFGWRLALNDIAGTEFLFGVLQDLDQRQSRSIKLEGALRLTDSLRLSLNGWLFQSNNPQDALFWLRRDDYLALQLTYFF